VTHPLEEARIFGWNSIASEKQDEKNCSENERERERERERKKKKEPEDKTRQ